MRQLLNNIIIGSDVRQSLSSLRQMIKDKTARNDLIELIEDHVDDMIVLLDNEDSKTRKNTALLMGDLGLYEFLEPLFQGYVRETQLFVKSAFLTAMKNFDYDSYVPAFKDRLEKLANTELTIENKKHTEEEMRELSELIISVEGITPHEFIGYHHYYDCILFTNRKYPEITGEQVIDGKLSPSTFGVRVSTKNIESLLPIRTYNEILFVIPGMKTCEIDAMIAAKHISSSNLLQMLQNSHTGTVPFYFRVNIISKMPLDKKSGFAKKLSSELEHLTERQLINSTSNYEFEIRLIENKNDSFTILIKLNTIIDERFSYRKEHIASSIKPVNAALLVALAKPYMIEDARILDPFCGVGTMLIERQKIVKGNTSYGIDTLEDAIIKAKINTEEAGQIIHYINKSFFDFTHDYLFDEIFTNMPFVIGHKTEDEIYELYDRFFNRAKSMMKRDGVIILYSHNQEYVWRLTKEKGYTIIKHFEVMTREDTHLFIIK